MRHFTKQHGKPVKLEHDALPGLCSQGTVFRKLSDERRSFTGLMFEGRLAAGLLILIVPPLKALQGLRGYEA